MAPEDMIEVEIHSDSAAVVTLRGEHDLCSKPAVMRALDAACFRANVVVDLSACTFIDSSLIAALLRAAQRVHRHDGLLELVVAPGARAIRRVLEVMDVQWILPVHETREAAIAFLESSQARSDALAGGLRLRAISEPPGEEEGVAGRRARRSA